MKIICKKSRRHVPLNIQLTNSVIVVRPIIKLSGFCRRFLKHKAQQRKLRKCVIAKLSAEYFMFLHYHKTKYV
jgi:hypothetical protein